MIKTIGYVIPNTGEMVVLSESDTGLRYLLQALQSTGGVRIIDMNDE